MLTPRPFDRRRLWAAFAVVVAFLSSSSPSFAQSAPAAGSSRASGLSGYMDLQFNKTEHTDGTLDFRRFVLLFAHRFSDRIRFVSELEVVPIGGEHIQAIDEPYIAKVGAHMSEAINRIEAEEN